MHESFQLPDGASIAYEILGQQHAPLHPPLVLISGMGGLRGDWKELASALSSNRTVLIYDHRGNGDSKFAVKQGDTITIASLADDLHILLTSLGWKKVALLGHSMGGVVAQQLCAFHYGPNIKLENPAYTITHIILAGTTASSEIFASGKYGFVYPNTPDGSSLEERKNIIRPATAQSFDPVWLADPRNSRRFDEILTYSATTTRSLKAIKRQSRAMVLFSLAGVHAHFPPPPHGPGVLIIHGKKDAIVPFFAGQDLLTLLPHARLIEEGSGPGKVDHLEFGHSWFEYFDVQSWVDVLEVFLTSEKDRQGAGVGRPRL